MRHRPAGTPLSARLVGAAARWGPLLAALRWRAGRFVFGGVVITAVTTVVLAVPVVSRPGKSTPAVALDASSSGSAARSDDGSPVVMGADGAPLDGPAFAGARATGTTGTAPTAAPGGDGAAGASTPGTSPAEPSPPEPSPSGTSPSGTSAAGTSAAGTSAAGTSAASTVSSASTGAGSGAPEPQPESAGPDAPLAAAPSAMDAADQVLALVNQERARTGCDALVTDGALARKARTHSADMRDQGFLGLVGPDGDSVLDGAGRAAAVAQGAEDPSSVVSGWLADPDDRATLLDCSLGSIGVGTADGNGDGGPWWTALLA